MAVTLNNLYSLPLLQLHLQHFIHLDSDSLALSLFHHLPDKKRKHFVFAAGIFLDLLGIIGDDFTDTRFDRAGVGDLLQVLAGDYLLGAVRDLPHGFEHLFGDFAGSGVIGDFAFQS